jgi:glycine/D-amino acid oxidase-like deaminating enzyme
MSHRYDIVIIGAGAGGATLARHLAPSGEKILLKDEVRKTMGGSSRKSRGKALPPALSLFRAVGYAGAALQVLDANPISTELQRMPDWNQAAAGVRAY